MKTTEGRGSRLGVWLLGARGGVAVTATAGARAMARGLSHPQGLVSSLPEFAGLGLVPLKNLVFGGHEVRPGTLYESALQAGRENGTFAPALLEELRPDLDAIDAEIRPGIATRCGPMVEEWADAPSRGRATLPLRAQIAALREDITAFRERHALERVIVVNLASTEAPLALDPPLLSIEALDRALDEDRREAVRASLLYAYAAIDAGCAYVNFTPSNAALAPAILQFAARRDVVVMGSDGKTGETLVKSTLAPLFHHRALRVLSWQGYNMLGDRDGEVLADADHRRSKIQSKDAVVGRILGYPVHTHVGIDYVPSLKDLKTAFDFIHFEGFMGFKMSLSFTWHGCDSILAAPLVLDLVRFTDEAQRSGLRGSLRHLACFFKNPLGVEEHDFHRQWMLLLDYAVRAESARKGEDGAGRAS